MEKTEFSIQIDTAEEPMKQEEAVYIQTAISPALMLIRLRLKMLIFLRISSVLIMSILFAATFLNIIMKKRLILP